MQLALRLYFEILVLGYSGDANVDMTSRRNEQ